MFPPNGKTDESSLEKASRSSILSDDPWHGVEHLRDHLRAKVHRAEHTIRMRLAVV